LFAVFAAVVFLVVVVLVVDVEGFAAALDALFLGGIFRIAE
jgi:hypothetical protein